jgi:hypothetical protein
MYFQIQTSSVDYTLPLMTDRSCTKLKSRKTNFIVLDAKINWSCWWSYQQSNLTCEVSFNKIVSESPYRKRNNFVCNYTICSYSWRLLNYLLSRHNQCERRYMVFLLVAFNFKIICFQLCIGLCQFLFCVLFGNILILYWDRSVFCVSVIW